MGAVNIIGAGLSGLSTAITLAEQGVHSRLVSLQPSERAQSVLAEGGINAALDTMGEGDRVENHYRDTMRGGAFLADPGAVADLTKAAPGIVRRLMEIGVPFNMDGDRPVLRNFGGQKLKRTAFAKSSTGKMIMNALIDRCRKFEAEGLVERLSHHEFIRLLTDGERCTGARIRDSFSGRLYDLAGPVVLCAGGMNGLFPAMTTGTTQNTSDAAAAVFSQGVALANPEMIQYHPTTVAIPGKRCLVTEGARGEGGRLFIERGGRPWYFMEEKYPELGNLMPRDVVAREMFLARRLPDTGDQVYLDLTGLSQEVWARRLPDLRDELWRYLGFDPAKEPVPVREGIHYFMGGIYVDRQHRSSLSGLWAAGECACQYHGANRLGGNSMLGAIYGGTAAARSLMSEDIVLGDMSEYTGEEPLCRPVRPEVGEQVGQVLLAAMGIVRCEEELEEALSRLDGLESQELSDRERGRISLARAAVMGALARRESRGAHFRSDCPEPDESFRKTTLARFDGGKISISFKDLPEGGEEP